MFVLDNCCYGLWVSVPDWSPSVLHKAGCNTKMAKFFFSWHPRFKIYLTNVPVREACGVLVFPHFLLRNILLTYWLKALVDSIFIIIITWYFDSPLISRIYTGTHTDVIYAHSIYIFPISISNYINYWNLFRVPPGAGILVLFFAFAPFSQQRHLVVP